VRGTARSGKRATGVAGGRVGKYSAIEWTDATWNPWRGCMKVSPGCKYCYMFREQERYGRDPSVVVRSKTTFYDPLKWREPRRIFTCSWSDWYHEDADPWRDEAWDIIRATPRHTYLILTKRPERFFEHTPWSPDGPAWPNVWLGVSVESQPFTRRIPKLIDTPAVVHFISAEPLLGPLDLTPWLPRLQWVIAGGESGAKARPMDPAWARALREQCLAVEPGVPFFFKQWGGVTAKAGGRELDGRTWDELPDA
jgi:protein gp37